MAKTQKNKATSGHLGMLKVSRAAAVPTLKPLAAAHRKTNSSPVQQLHMYAVYSSPLSQSVLPYNSASSCQQTQQGR
jgi:ribosome-interacting GTPase 1